jgi:hypothetical protein
MQRRLGDVDTETFEPCPGCAQPDHCGGRWPEDGNFRPGQLRGCFAEKARSVAVEPAGSWVREREREMSKDNDAYRRLRRDGVQPKRVDGSAKLEATMN